MTLFFKKHLFVLMIRRKYVNMADIKYERTGLAKAIGANHQNQHLNGQSEPLLALAELLFFAYRDFTGDADEVLAEIGFGRAHHRVLHFVTRRPGLRVAELLVILNITKQSLARVLRQLIDKAYIAQKPGEADKRERLLYATPSGEALAARLANAQAARLNQAMSAVGPRGAESIARFLLEMISQDEDQPFSAIAALTGLTNHAGDETQRA